MNDHLSTKRVNNSRGLYISWLLERIDRKIQHNCLWINAIIQLLLFDNPSTLIFMTIFTKKVLYMFANTYACNLKFVIILGSDILNKPIWKENSETKDKLTCSMNIKFNCYTQFRPKQVKRKQKYLQNKMMNFQELQVWCKCCYRTLNTYSTIYTIYVSFSCYNFIATTKSIYILFVYYSSNFPLWFFIFHDQWDQWTFLLQNKIHDRNA